MSLIALMNLIPGTSQPPGLSEKPHRYHQNLHFRRAEYAGAGKKIQCHTAAVFYQRGIWWPRGASACSFVGSHTAAFLFNAFIVFVSLSLVYLFRRRAFFRIFISGFWIILGIINGCILSNRVTPFGFTDLKCINDLFAMNNTNYFTAEEATIVVIGLGAFFLFCAVLFIKGPRYQGKIHKIVVLASIS